MGNKKTVKVNGHFLGIILLSLELSLIIVFGVNYYWGETKCFGDEMGPVLYSSKVSYVHFNTPFGSHIHFSVKGDNLTFWQILDHYSSKKDSFRLKCAWKSLKEDYKAILIIFSISVMIGSIILFCKFKFVY